MASTPKRSAGAALEVTVEGLDELRALPHMLEEGERAVLEGATKKLGLSIATAAPGGPVGGIGRSVITRVITDTTSMILIRHPGAKPAEKGAYRRAKSGALRFRDGTFAMWSRQRPTRFATIGLSPRRKIITGEYKAVFADLERTTSAGKVV